MRRTKGPERYLKLPPLQPEQQAMVIGNLGLALKAMARKYIETLGDGRVHEFEQFRDEMINAFKNADFAGAPIQMEAAVVEATIAVIQGVMPVINRYNGGLDSESE